MVDGAGVGDAESFGEEPVMLVAFENGFSILVDGDGEMRGIW